MKISGYFITVLTILICSIGQTVHYLFRHLDLSQMQYFMTYGWLPSMIIGLSLWLNLKFFIINEIDFEMIKWWYWSRFPLCWYWINKKAYNLRRLLAGDSVSNSRFDWVSCVGFDKYHNTLKILLIKTGRNIYGQKLN